MMEEEINRIIDYYSKELDTYKNRYLMMGNLLQKHIILKSLKEKSIESVYVYGGGFLGAQTYLCLKDLVNVKAVVDQNGRLSHDIKYIPVIDLQQLKFFYQNEFIIITLAEPYKKIVENLLEYVDKEKIVFVGELMGEMV